MPHSDDAQQSKARDLEIDQACLSWKKPMKDWLIGRGKDGEWDGIATACVVFNDEGKVLVIQRASHDSLPNKWELPGGAVDADDLSILHAAARELQEESGMIATQFTDVVTLNADRDVGELFRNKAKTLLWCRFTFLVEVQSSASVTLDPNEHQDYHWASEDEIRQQRRGGRELSITKDSVAAIILEAFRMRRKRTGAL